MEVTAGGRRGLGLKEGVGGEERLEGFGSLLSRELDREIVRLFPLLSIEGEGTKAGMS